MNFKLNDDLKNLAELAGTDVVTFTTTVLKQLDENDIIYDEYKPEYFGNALKDCFERNININEIRAILNRAGIAHIDGGVLDMFGGLIVIGDGDCPKCGGIMNYDSASEEMTGDGYITPREPLYELWVCSNCGHIEKR